MNFRKMMLYLKEGYVWKENQLEADFSDERRQ